MNPPTFHGVIRGGCIVLLDDDVPLPDGTHVTVTPMDPQPVEAEDFLSALQEVPPVSPEDAAELMRAIEEGTAYRPSARWLEEEASSAEEA